jgi:lipopolysaccharide/colanic/teichoic acid biosynthesis glycosyltransferase
VQVEQVRLKTLAATPAVGGQRVYRQVIKRAFDVVLAFVALVLLWPIMLTIGILIRLDSPGSALFIQKRIGKDGRPFRIYKFRTMAHHLDDSAHVRYMQAFVKGNLASSHSSPARNGSDTTYKPFTESQVTRLGRILRKTSLDELPQLVNVLKGEMSLVGPRPNVPYEVQEYKEWHRERLTVLPGITGLAQVKGRSTLEFDAIASYDIQYARKQSFALDVQILVNTLGCVVKGKGAH